MRRLIFIAYSIGALIAILYAALPIGGHVSGGMVMSMAGGWGYGVLYLIAAALTWLALRPAMPGAVARTGLAFIVSGLATAGVVMLLQPTPPGHMALSIALAGLTALIGLFFFAALFGRDQP